MPTQKAAMPAAPNNKKVTDFFKRFSAPKNQIYVNEVIEDEIIVAPRPPGSFSQASRPEDASLCSTPKKDSARGSSTEPSSSNNVFSPTRALPIGTPRKSSQLEGYTDSRPVASSRGSSQTRTLKAVEAPSPRVSPPLPQVPAEPPVRVPFASFSSISTLSSVPMSSASSSRRIVKDGIKAVTNSDSGSADSDSDELADPMTFMSRKRRRLTPPSGQGAQHAIEIMDSAQTVRQSGRLSDRDRRSGAGLKMRLPPSPPRNVYKHSLMKLVKQKEKETNTANRVREAEAQYEEAQRKREERIRQDQDVSAGLKVATADDSDEGERMMLAMQRTEALQEEEKFYFFRKDIRVASKEFPILRQPWIEAPKQWMELLEDERSRHHAFLSGFMADVAAKEQLPSLLISWMESQLLFEPRPDLCEAYVEVLEASAPRSSLASEGMQGLCYYYSTLGSIEKDAHDDRSTIPPGPPRSFRQVLEVLQQLCIKQTLSPASAASLIVDLMIAEIDEQIRRSADLVSEIHDVLENVLEAIPTEDQFALFCKLVHKAFCERSYLCRQRQCEIISSLPATSERTHHLRRVLALHLAAGFKHEEDYRHNINSPFWVDIIKRRLESAPEFNISETTDYNMLASFVEVLDIAIDAGFSDPGSQIVPSVLVKTKIPFGKPVATPTSESTFNSQIDTLTAQLRHLSSQIRGSGTSHLRRTEAKSAIDRLILRLEHGVRTKPKPRKGIFGDSLGEQQDFLSSFLKPIAAKPEEEEDFVEVVPREMLSDREISDRGQTSEEASAVSGAESM